MPQILFNFMHGISGFVIGAILGSFVTLISHRMPRGQSIVSPRSRCPACNAQLDSASLVPILSWLINHGKCRNCRTPVPQRYPLIELLCAILCTSLFVMHPLGIGLFMNLILVVLGVTIVVIDFEDAEQPRALFAATLLMGLIHIPLAYLETGRPALYPVICLIVATIAYVRGFAAEKHERILWFSIIPVAMALLWFDPADFLTFLIASSFVVFIAEYYYSTERIERRYILAGLTFCWILTAVT
ncbi:MAG: hypothetical protein GC131_01875 [Alphaproteobacteria bacterium]|nr:hypothetical protein [Alphaproteobacteria bacterium]